MESDALIATFVAAMGTDPEVARRYLDLGDWDINKSVNLFLGGGNGGNADDDYCEIRDPIAPKEERVLDLGEIQEQNDAFGDGKQNGGGGSSSKTKRKKVVGGGVTITETVKTTVVAKGKNGKSIGAFRNFKDEAEAMSENKTKRKAERLNDIFMPPIDLLFNGSFEDCKAAAAQANKLVVVNVQDKEEFSSYTLNRDIWADKRIASVIRLNYVLIQIDRDSSEGRDFGRIYNVPAYPHVSIVDGLTGECMWIQTFAFKNNDELSHKYDAGRSRELKDISGLSEEDQIQMAIAESLKPRDEFSFNDLPGDNDWNFEDFPTSDEEDDEKENGKDGNDDDDDDDDDDESIPKNQNEKKNEEKEKEENVEEKKRTEAVHANVKRKAEGSGELGQYQFKIRDLEGKSMNASFVSSDSVQDIRDYVDANMKPKGPYKIYLSYPKRLLDDNAQISDLNLPIRAVLVLQRK